MSKVQESGTGNMTLSVGRDLHCVPDLNAAITSSGSAGFDFMVVPIVHPRFNRDFTETTPCKERTEPFTRSDLLLPASDWTRIVVGRTSSWIDVDSPCPSRRKNSVKALHQELDFALHLGLPGVVIRLQSGNCMNLARIINDYLNRGIGMQFWIQVPLLHPAMFLDDVVRNSKTGDILSEPSHVADPWHWWNTLRTLCNNSGKLGLVPELQKELPAEVVLSRLCGEPVQAAVIPTEIFLLNQKGFPVLPVAHQALLQRLFKLNIQPIVSGTARHEKGMRVYLQYLCYLFRTMPAVDEVESFAKGYEDYLQSPLQPLMDNLESQTYEVFEKDPVKYKEYQEAVYLALLDRVPAEERQTRETVVMVVGAGRGPLVRQSLIAAERAKCLVRVFAVEKNPNAVVTLRTIKEEEWGDKVTVVSCDMRLWKAPVKADILVSELLGSFGDNELSPECLDGAQSFLKDDGISIPCKYTSYLAPLSAPRMHHSIGLTKDNKEKGDPFEIPYVVRLHNVSLLAKPQSVFSFVHPNRPSPEDGPIDNERFISLSFSIKEDSVLHGFAGYFDTDLYKDVMLSILPATHSPGMFSWFPIFFPLKEPVMVSRDCTVEVHMWRLCSRKQVWYEWCLTKPYPSHIHNTRGDSHKIGL